MVRTTDDRSVELVTRRGKHHIVDADDPNLRAASWWERLLFRDRFPQAASSLAARTAV